MFRYVTDICKGFSLKMQRQICTIIARCVKLHVTGCILISNLSNIRPHPFLVSPHPLAHSQLRPSFLLFHTSVSLSQQGLLFCQEDGSSRSLRNFRNFLQIFTVSHPRRLRCSGCAVQGTKNWLSMEIFAVARSVFFRNIYNSSPFRTFPYRGWCVSRQVLNVAQQLHDQF
jgi:hypothetical protein